MCEIIRKIVQWVTLCAWLAILVAGAGPTSLSASESMHWPQWRGPNANGVVDGGKPPLTWGATENLAWVTQLPGKGASTPIIVGKRLFVVSAEETAVVVVPPIMKHAEARTEPPLRYYRFWLLALDRESGEELWRKKIVEAAPHEGHHRTNTYAGGSPVSDGERLYLSLGSRGIYTFDLDGALLWKRDLGQIRTRRGWGEASTPAVHGANLIIPWDQEDQSRLVNLDAESGEILWEVARNEPSNWSTPVFLPSPGGMQVVLNGTNRARGYSLLNGRSIWEVGTLSVNAIPSPVFDDNFVYCMSGYQKSIAFAIPRGAVGDLTDSTELGWIAKRNTPYVASPLLYRGMIYMTKGLGSRISILNAKTGEAVVEAEPLTGLSNVYASPIGVNGFVYIVDREGNTAVLRAGNQLDVVSINRINDTVDASPVVVGDRLYLRSWNAVYCFTSDE